MYLKIQRDQGNAKVFPLLKLSTVSCQLASAYTSVSKKKTQQTQTNPKPNEMKIHPTQATFCLVCSPLHVMQLTENINIDLLSFPTQCILLIPMFKEQCSNPSIYVYILPTCPSSWKVRYLMWVSHSSTLLESMRIEILWSFVFLAQGHSDMI